MERLTKIIDGGVVFPRELVGIALTPDNDYMHKLLKRLAAYEDTGLEPEDIDALQKREQGLAELLVNVSCGCAVSYARLQELAQAEKDGRLVVLPCKVGDIVYRIAVRGKYLNHSMETPYIKTVEIKPENAHKYIDEIGKTVFLTREKAEAALKKRKEEDNETD